MTRSGFATERRRRRRRGSSTLEVLVATAVTTVIAFAVGAALRDSSLAVAEVNTSVVSDATTRAALLRVLDELRFAGRDAIDPLDPVDATTIRYSQIVGWENDAPAFSPWQQFSKIGDKLYHDGEAILDNVVTFEVTRTADTLEVVIVSSYTAKSGQTTRVLERALRGRVVLSN